MLHQGMDVASMQHPGDAKIDFGAAFVDLLHRGNGLQPFAIVKLTEVGKRADGSTWVYDNPYAKQDIAGLRAAGFAVAGYHFVHGNAAAEEQIAAIRAHLDSVDFVWLDCEVSDGATPQAFDALLSAIVAGVGMRVGIYVNQSFRAFIAQGGFAESFALWFADPSDTDPTRPRAITQTGQGMVAGVTVTVDLDTCEDANFKVLWPPAVTPESEATPGSTTVVDPVDPAATTAAPEVVSPSPAVAENPELSPTATAGSMNSSTTQPPAAQAQPQGVIAVLPVVDKNCTDPEMIKRVQGLLIAAGHNLGTTGVRHDGVDGGWGIITQREALLFQNQAGIKADAEVGPVTWTALLGASA